MKLFLTSNGLSNESIKKAFLELVGKPAQDVKVAFIPTAAMSEDGDKDWLINDLYRIRQAVGYVDIVDIAQLRREEWLPRLEVADVIFVGGGNTFYLSYWMEKSGLLAMLPELLETRVYAGISAGSIFVGDSLKVSSEVFEERYLDKDYYEKLGPAGRSLDVAAKFVPFTFRPHLNSEYFPRVREDILENAAKHYTAPMYALDDNSALKIVDGNVTVVSEGKWRLFNET